MHQPVNDLIHKDDRNTFQQHLKYDNSHDYPDDMDSPGNESFMISGLTCEIICKKSPPFWQGDTESKLAQHLHMYFTKYFSIVCIGQQLRFL